MKALTKGVLLLIMGCLLLILVHKWQSELKTLPAASYAEHTPLDAVNGPETCARLIRFGQSAFERSRYMDAKRFFRQAIVADPASTVAWRKYHMALLAVLAEKIEMNPAFLDDSADTVESPSGTTEAPAAGESDDGGC